MTDNPRLPVRHLGELAVSAQGLGCMGMSQSYGPADDEQSIGTIHRALDVGVTLLDTSDAYGRGHNEELIGRALADRRDRAVIATKFGFATPAGAEKPVIRGDADYVRQACEASLRRLGVDHIDLYYQHRVDPKTPIEEKNLSIVDRLTELAQAMGVSPGQLALAWVQHRGADVVPIPGTRRQKYLDENVAAATLELSADELAAIDAAAPAEQVAGARYSDALLALSNR